MTSTSITAASLPRALPGPGFSVPVEGGGSVQVYGAPTIHGAPGASAEGSRPILLVHSVNAAASAYEVRPLYERLGPSRPTYALDLPGYGLSDRDAAVYTPRLMTDALHAVVEAVRDRHGGAPVDALALSLSCEFLARAATERPERFRTLALVSPTGLDGGRRRDGPPESTRGSPVLRSLLTCSLWDDALFRALTRPGVVRYFLERTWGGKAIDEGLWEYDVETARVSGAKHAPLAFLSGYLFSNDVSRLYDTLEQPVWVSHGVRGDFVDYRRAEAMAARDNWAITVFQTGALPHFEVLDDFLAAYEAFLASAG